MEMHCYILCGGMLENAHWLLMGKYTIDADVEALSLVIQYIILTGSCSYIKNTPDPVTGTLYLK